MVIDDPHFTVYTSDTPNGVKVTMALEELGLSYRIHEIQLGKMEQKEEWYLKINPNGRIPSLVDHKRNNFHVFESGAILLYLGDFYDPNGRILPLDPNKRSIATQWLIFQASGIGPMQGQAHHFYRYAPEKIPYAIDRYQKETRRLYEVLEHQLSDGREYIAGPFSVADIATFGWVALHEWAGVSLDGLTNLEKWLHRCAERPDLARGYRIPKDNHLIENNFKISETMLEQKSRTSGWIRQ